MTMPDRVPHVVSMAVFIFIFYYMYKKAKGE